MKHIIFDDLNRDNFYPLTLNRSTGDLRLGILKLSQRIAAYFDIKKNNLIVSKVIQDVYVERNPEKFINHVSCGENVFINSRLKVNDDWVEKINSLPTNTMYYDGKNVIAARCSLEQTKISSEDLISSFMNLSKIKIYDDHCWENLWELITNNADFIEQDFQDFFCEADNHFEIEMGVTVLNPYNIWIGEKAELKPGVIVDASKGPVIIDEETLIMPNSVIIGPVYIGKNTTIKANASIYGGTSIGPFCKVGGELEASIIQAYSNKQHDGFLGHSYIGEWVNLGANTNNSDLKNNYKTVSAYYYPQKSKKDTGFLFAGTLIGDHSKTAIGTTINTGTIIGIGCNLVGNEIVKDHVQSFSWGRYGSYEKYCKDRFLETCNLVKRRRKLSLSDSEKELYNFLINRS